LAAPVRSPLAELARRYPEQAAAFRVWLHRRVEAIADLQATEIRGGLDEVQRAREQADALEDRLNAAASRLDTGEIRSEMTVHAAHARDPRVRRIFAERGLPDCPSCAVGAEETLAEAAAGEGFPLDELLARLRALES
jgi:hypothetical protein